MRYFTLHNKHWIGDRLKHVPNINPEDLLCQTAGPNSLPHLLYHCNHIKPLWNTVTDTFNEITRIVPDEQKINIQKQDFFFGQYAPQGKPYQKSQLHLLDILIGNMQLAIFSCHFPTTIPKQNQAKNAILRSGEITCQNPLTLIVSASNKKRPLHIWKLRGHSKFRVHQPFQLEAYTKRATHKTLPVPINGMELVWNLC